MTFVQVVVNPTLFALHGKEFDIVIEKTERLEELGKLKIFNNPAIFKLNSPMPKKE